MDTGHAAASQLWYLPMISRHRKAIATKGRAGARRGLSRPVVAAIDASKILGVRAGAESTHRFIGIWAVVIDGRVYGRSWSLKPGGWYRTLLEDPRGAMKVGEREIPIRAAVVRSERLRDAVEAAYAAKYQTPGSRTFVRGFRTKRRRAATMEFRAR